MMPLGIVLIHGYTGTCQDLQPLAATLAAKFGEDSVTNLSLPGHHSETIPAFDAPGFVETIHQAIRRYQNEQRKIIVIGHSTGGNLAISTLQEYSIRPDLLTLISVPRKIDWSYFERWTSHRAGKGNVPLTNVALMVKFINSTGVIKFHETFPVLILHGENDELVLPQESHAWNVENFSNTARVLTIPQTDHHVINHPNHHLAIDVICRAIADIPVQDDIDPQTIQSLMAVEPGLKDFFKASPSSKRHLSLCPSGQCVIGKKPVLQTAAMHEPIIANIEITTYCNLKCKFCARTQDKKRSQHMPVERFSNILGLLPHCYKIVLVGLGEPLLHPEITRMIQIAKSLKKKVGLVTNGMLLEADISYRLLEAGLDSIAFSLDGYDASVSSLVRNGTDFPRVIRNIKEFVAISNTTRKISMAVFSAVSKETISHLKSLIDQVSDLGADVLMLSDINFQSNLSHTLWQNVNAPLEEMVKRAVSHAFSKNLPVLSVHGLEEFGLEERYQDFLLIPPGQLYRRSPQHAWCYSPWQTIPVDVEGNITLCDCQPGLIIGNLFQDSFSDIWNGETLKKYRAQMLSPNPPDACKICPRF
jgi:MoaA/NifB/PqqE/SkfB family radical SAM enzyme/pimeloyl-ACP methyl ester carboxylesterase